MVSVRFHTFERDFFEKIVFSGNSLHKVKSYGDINVI